ncbi:cobyric acid synthase [Azospirillum picis]|uniref:Cobyric acid synthase n=1 Tax=Azospirillum picis TaxID=488438 RepID=A0ABU0MRS5_9PROT|nr:cobyric acid synthase [Azospirillum picis]MBP2302574.1 adenosylcobyric acid synthase [Azospirillum picis]MDQ0536184.1 adenosylcobyric acid synthase [Azospirillum picis]
MTFGAPASRAIMLQGTGSDVGKSLLVAGLCRALVRRGLTVRPFKPQNMSNNAAVTADGGEIGRAQALQARACGVAPSVHMNPVLLKPQSDIGSQVVVRGVVVGTARAADYQARKRELLGTVLDSFGRLKAEADIVVVEGAGSPAEVNLRAGDIANMGFATAAGVPVLLVGDIDRGGVIASLVGTHALLPPDERERIKGFLINKFRGDVRLFDEGLRVIERHTGWRGFGVVPWLGEAATLPAEDAVALDRPRGNGEGGGAAIRIAVPMLSRIANFDDFDPLAQEPGVALTMVPPGQPLPADADVVILPGTKATIADLVFLRAQGWDIDLLAHWRRGGRVLGICGGYQMLGRRIADPDGIEGPPGEIAGLGLLDVETVMKGPKVLEEARGTERRSGEAVAGYEMHMGRTDGPDRVRPMLDLAGGVTDGAGTADGRVAGCYLHGLFTADGFRAVWLRALGGGSDLAYGVAVERALDAIADRLEGVVDVDGLLAVAE